MGINNKIVIRNQQDIFNLATPKWRIFIMPLPCLEWTRAKSGCGYGNVRFQGRNWGVHRLAYELAVEKVPQNLVIDHICANPRCCKPSHLRVVTHRENIVSGIGFSGKNNRKSHCPNDHEYNNETTCYFIEKSGNLGRSCKICKSERDKNRTRVRKPTGNPVGRPKQTHCKRGHELSGENIQVRKDGYTACKICRNIREKRHSS